MKSPKTKQDLIEKVVEQIESDLHCGFKETVEELLKFVPVENLIAFLPEEDWKHFKHLKDEPQEIRTENALTNLIKQFPNDQELGKEIRQRWKNK